MLKCSFMKVTHAACGHQTPVGQDQKYETQLRTPQQRPGDGSGPWCHVSGRWTGELNGSRVNMSQLHRQNVSSAIAEASP